MVTAAGSGGLTYDGLAVTRYGGDATRDADGVYLYLRDLDDGRTWSAGYQPTAGEPEEYEAELSAGVVRLDRVEAAIRAQTEICVCPETDVELRRYTLGNLGARERTIEFTSYLEWVLQNAAADAAHPAFSKLFVETEIRDAEALILARRRVRDPRDPTLVGAHWLVQSSSSVDARGLQFETSRVRFIGRGRTLREPASLTKHGSLSGTCGPVLDPIASIRGTLFLPPHESASITLAVAARSDQPALEAAIRSLRPEDVDDAFRNAAAAAAQANGADHHRDAQAALRIDMAHRRPSAARGSAVRYERLRERATAVSAAEPLQFDNGLGGFSSDGREYVLRLRPDRDGRPQLPPTPWSHVVANPHTGFIATETGAGGTWTVNSRENRLTHWANDPVSDPPSEAFYLRDRQRRVYWSPTPGPVGPGVVHTVRYAFGSACYEHTSAQLRQRVEQFVPRNDAVKIIRLSLENDDESARELDLFFYAHLALGNGVAQQAAKTRTWFDDAAGVMFAANSGRELSERVAFATIVAPGAGPLRSWTSDRTEFLGQYGDLAAPAAVVESAALSGHCGPSQDACAALHASLRLEGQAAAECWVLLGEADDEVAARELIARYSTGASIDAALSDVRQFWRNALSAVEIDTPSPAMNVMVNGWLPYQDLCCRLWGRSAYYQSGGAFGFRDQLQDAAALVYHLPAMTREQILRHAAAQFVEGDVLHWWHPPEGRGIRTRFSDDLLWLPLVAAEYVATTGDAALWDQPAPFLVGPQLEPGEVERFIAPTLADESATIYEHACRAVDRSLATGVHGLPLMGCGDWNDGMNCVGAGGRGESVWMAFFLDFVIQRMLPVCETRGDRRRAAAYREHQRRLRHAIDVHGWDGAWFRRAYFDDGTPLGSAANGECQIDALVQAWAVLSGVADRDQAEQAIAAAERRLVRDDLALIQLLDPPFDQMAPNPGYIQGYVPGVRENGGQYTHGALWHVRALAELGRGNRAVELLDMLNPIHHARTPEEVAVYQVEPYVVAADVYSQPPHAGRGGWTWYTGSAGWMVRVAVESILGLRIRDGRELILNPSISAAWPSCRVKYRLPSGGGAYEVTIENPDRQEHGVSEATVDDQPAVVEDGVARIPLVADGGVHRVRLRL